MSLMFNHIVCKIVENVLMKQQQSHKSYRSSLIDNQTKFVLNKVLR